MRTVAETGVDFEVVLAVTYGSSIIPYEVVRSKRRTLAIHVYPDGRVEVRAPQSASEEDVRERVGRRARWIVRQQRRYAELVDQQPEKEYVIGETHLYLGRPYRLRVEPVEEREGHEEGVRLRGRYLVVSTVMPGDAGRTRRLVKAWYRRRAEHHLRVRFEAGCAVMARYDVAPPPMQIRSMRQRWGSCTPAGQVLLNPRLVLAPTTCIDYVVIHELCHLRHPHHGHTFTDLLRRVMPDWQSRKEQLERIQ